MTLEEQCRLSYYRKIADISTHKNVCLVQHVENNRIFVKKEQEIYCREVYEYLRECNNPHIPRIFECIEDEGKLIIIEEYIQGESLAVHLEETGVYTQEEVCRFMITICDVLEQLHQLPRPVIHRDLKPENILIQENGYLKIIDFNTAKQYEQGKGYDTVIIGTRKYAAPEQFGYRQSDARTDIYAMGIMMNYLLTKKYPDEYLYKTEKHGRISVPDIINKCIEFSPDSRYQTVMDLRRDLQTVLARMIKTNRTGTDNLQEKLPEKRSLWTIPFLLPGFRTGVVWKMILGGIGYLLIFWLGLSTEFTKPDGSSITGFYLWANRLTCLIWCLLTIAFYADYLGLQKYLPFMQRKYLRWVGYLLWPIIFLFALILILAIIGG
ncbi:MAG: serine/threonine-protein kinase [Eubacteriales bacterium]|nr:serine/threonine-protein kinase [Eubacteriales bacterium]